MKKTIAKKTTLFQYQKDCLEAIKKTTASKGRALMAIAVGYGRTTIVALALKELFEERRIKHALIVVPRKVLEYQFTYVLHEHSLESIKLVSYIGKRPEPKLEQRALS